MYEYAIAWEWLAFAARWFHVITAIAWIGSSFYFIALDLGLVKRPHLSARRLWRGMAGAWRRLLPHPEISGGARDQMPEHLTWFKYESYFTWLSGFLMLCIVYYGGADLFLIDRHVLDISRDHRDPDFARLARRRLDRLRPALQVAARQEHLGR